MPDLPWILQRLCRFFPVIDPFDLRLYVVIQASLFFSLILSAAFSLLSISPWKTFSILASGTFFHLFFDALQIKWANGVHFFAPFSWDLTQFSFVWPESFVSYAVTVFGLAYALYYWKTSLRAPFPLNLKSPKHLIVAAFLILIYLLLPLALLEGPERANNHFVQTLRAVEDRKGKVIEVDRVFYSVQGEKKVLKLFNGEKIKVTGIDLPSSAVVSIRGKFTAKDKISVDVYHLHSKLRDLASYMGLAFIAILWLWSALRHVLTRP